MDRGDYDREQKNACRTRMLSGLRPATSVLTLPGIKALCVREMLERQIIGSRTKQVWIERRGDRLGLIRAQAETIGVTPTIVRSDIENYDPLVKFDLANLDMEQVFSLRFGHWLETKMAPRLKRGASVIFTFTDNYRNQAAEQFVEWANERIASDPLIKGYRDQIVETLNNDNVDFIRSYLLVAFSLSNFDFRLGPVANYADSRTPMHCFRIDDVRRRTSEEPVLSFSEFVSDFHYKPYSARYFGRKTMASHPSAVAGVRAQLTRLDRTAASLFKDLEEKRARRAALDAEIEADEMRLKALFSQSINQGRVVCDRHYEVTHAK